jgi:hypothetical protein
MTKQTQENLNTWVRNNLWNLIVTTVLIVIAFVTVQAKVTALELKTADLEIKIAQYPSQDYFDLKFKTIESQLLEVKQDLKAHLAEK